jgi:hypothetical protein
MQRVIIAGATVCSAVSLRHTKDSAVHGEKQFGGFYIRGWVACQDKVAIRFNVTLETRPVTSPRGPLTFDLPLISKSSFFTNSLRCTSKAATMF